MPFASSRGSLSSSQDFDAQYDADTQAAIHRLYIATNDFDVVSAEQRRPSLDSAKGAPKPMSTTILVREAVTREVEPPEHLPPVSMEPPMSLEDLVGSNRWQRTRGATQSSSTPALHSALSTARSPRDRSSWISQSVGSSKNNLNGIRSGFLRKGQRVVNTPIRRGSQANALVPAAREILACRKTARGNQFKADSKFTDGRRRAALMGAVEHLEKEQLDPTFSEVSRKLQREGWQMDEVKDHLLLLAEDPYKFKITSGRELCEVRPQLLGQESSQLPSIDEACGGSTQVDCAFQVRGIVQEFRERSESMSSLPRKG